MKDFDEFFVPSAIPDRKAAASAVAAGAFSGILLVCVFGTIATVLRLRDGRTSISMLSSIATIVMALVTIGTWKRILAAPLIGLLIGAAIIVWELTQGKIWAIFLAVPIVGGFGTAMRGIAVLKRLRDQSQPVPPDLE